jgi:hemerythrin-like domain-containing protein
MASITQALRDEHRELLQLLERVRTAAEAVDSGVGVRQAVDAATEFLAGHLLPHAAAEEASLYPEVARLMNSELATKTMEVDHAEVRRLTNELDQVRSGLTDQPPTPEQARQLRRLLFGLYTLVNVHFVKEEEVYLPLLEAKLSDEAATAMLARMEQEAAEARRRG